MDNKIRQIQLKVLRVFKDHRRKFALAGGTALDIYYLHHRFSRDLDFFCPEYDISEIEDLKAVFEQALNSKLILENEFKTDNKARVRFYLSKIKAIKEPFKIGFIEDVFFDKPKIKIIKDVPVYDVDHINFQKIMAVTGTNLSRNNVGKDIITGRNAAKDIIDIYYLSKKITPLHKYLATLTGEQQKGMILWYQTYSRQELRFDSMDLDIYDNKFDSTLMIQYIDKEIKKFMQGIIS